MQPTLPPQQRAIAAVAARLTDDQRDHIDRAIADTRQVLDTVDRAADYAPGPDERARMLAANGRSRDGLVTAACALLLMPEGYVRGVKVRYIERAVKRIFLALDTDTRRALAWAATEAICDATDDDFRRGLAWLHGVLGDALLEELCDPSA